MLWAHATLTGWRRASGVFTASEPPVSAIALVVLDAVMLVRDNLRGLLVMRGVILAGVYFLRRRPAGEVNASPTPIAQDALA